MTSHDGFAYQDRPDAGPVRAPLPRMSPTPGLATTDQCPPVGMPALRLPMLRLPAAPRSHGLLATALRRLAAGRRPAHPVGPPSTPAASDRRAFPRRDSGCCVLVCRRTHDASAPQPIEWQLHSGRLRGDLVDLSMNGVAFLLDEPAEPGEGLELRLTNRRLDRQTDVSAQVIRCLEVGPNQWKIVCQLRRRLTFEQVHEFARLLPGRIV